MAKFINMPKMGNTVTSVIFGEWFVKENDDVKIGDKLFSYETDKTTTEELAKEDGTVLKLIAQPNDEIPVFDHVMIIGKKGEDISTLLNEITTSKSQEEVKTESSAKSIPEVQNLPAQEIPTPAVETIITNKQAQNNVNNNEIIGGISPRALQLLRKSGIPINAIHYASGPNNRIVSNDVVKAMSMQNLNANNGAKKQVNQLRKKIDDILKLANTKSGDETFNYPRMRAAIAKGMIQSQKQSVFTTLTMSINANQLLETRNQFKNAIAQGGPNITINDLIIYGVSRVLPKYKKTINAHVEDNKATLHNHANIAMAVDTPQGLIVPVIKEANLKSLIDISNEAKSIIKFVKNASYENVDLRSGTFTISNVGGLGIEVFTPVLNAGQAAILGVGTTVLKPRLNKQGMMEFYQAMILSLTIDHRLADGADGARFLNDVKLILENIDLII